MKYLAILISLGFIGMAVFGFVGMAADLGYGHTSCIAVIVNQTNCPESAGTLAFSAFHTSALKKFSTAVFTLTFLFLTIGLFAVLAENSIFPGPLFNFAGIIAEEFFVKKPNRLISWLSLHEASPQLI